MSQIAKSTFNITILSALGLCLGFLSNAVIAAKFGARQDMDIFLAATTLPLFITTILSGSLNLTFIPVFADYRTKEINEIWTVTSSIININILLTAVLCFIGVVLAYPIMKLIAPGFIEADLLKAAELLRLLFPIIIINVVNSLMASVYYSNQRFLIPSLNNMLSPIITMTYVVLFHNFLSTKSIVIAMLSAAVIQMLLLVIGFVRTHDFKYSFVFDFKHPGVIKVFKLMTPLIFGMLIYRATPLIDRYFLSMLPVGSISHIEYAQKLVGVIPQLITSGISIAIFPVMAKYAAENNFIELKMIMSKGIKQVLFFIIPVIFFLSVSGLAIVKLVYERGAFGLEDSLAVCKAFNIYVLALVFTTANNLTNCYYVLKDTMTPFIVGTISTVLYIFLCFLLLKFNFGYLAFPIAYLFYYSFIIVHAIIIRKKLGGIGGKYILKSIFQYSIVSLIIALLLLTANYYFYNTVLKITLFLASFIIYYIICNYGLHLEEAKNIQKRVAHILNYCK